ncbi:MAG: hypothetical protein AAGI37_17830 [Planctomycetota bacterium]
MDRSSKVESVLAHVYIDCPACGERITRMSRVPVLEDGRLDMSFEPEPVQPGDEATCRSCRERNNAEVKKAQRESRRRKSFIKTHGQPVKLAD